MTNKEQYFREIPSIIRTTGELPASRFNALVGFVMRNRLLGVRAEETARFRHPWQHSLSWQAEGEAWLARVRRGYVYRSGGRVSGADNLLEVTGDTPIASEPPREPWEDIQVTLDRDAWRALGSDADPLAGETETIPQKFLDLGVTYPEGVTIDTDDLSITFTAANVEEPVRLLRAQDVVLQIPRDSVALDVRPNEAGTLQIFTSYQTNRDAPRIYPTRRFFADPDLLAAEITPDWLDDPWHRVHLATVYLLSPPETPAGSEPDGTWQPHVAHRFFYNLAHHVSLPDPATQSEPLSADGLTGLAAGVGDRLIRDFIDQINASQALAELLLAKLTVGSKVWSL